MLRNKMIVDTNPAWGEQIFNLTLHGVYDLILPTYVVTLITCSW